MMRRIGILLLMSSVNVTISSCYSTGRERALRVDLPDTLAFGAIVYDERPVTDYTLISTEGGVVLTPTVEARSVEGVVVNERTGQPLRAVQVVAGARGALTDTVGRFRLAQLPGDYVTLEIGVIGHARARLRLDTRPDSGYAVVIPLEPTPLRICADRFVPFPSIAVRIVDARTGRAPSGVPFRLELREGRYHEVHEATAQGDSLVMESDRWRMGVYEVTITAPSYAPWRMNSVLVGVDHCGTAQQRYLTAVLLPEGRTLSR